jgi:hypothetical protein
MGSHTVPTVCFSSASIGASEAPLIGAVVGGEEWTRRTHLPLAFFRHRFILCIVPVLFLECYTNARTLKKN